MTKAPRLTIGLPCYNGEQYLAEALDALLGQSYEDFELIISDNASTDSTADICRKYEKQDSRVRHLRQPQNLGLAPNHNVLVHEARGELFKWASDDDLYARDLIKVCVDALDAHPEIVLAHSWTAIINDAREVTRAVPYPHATGSPSAPERFRSLLFGAGGDDDGGIIRTSVLRRTPLNGSYYRADRTLVCEIALHGAFHHIPEWLYFRRDHPNRAARAFRSVHSWCVNLDPPAREQAAQSGGPAVLRIPLGLHQARSGGLRSPRRSAVNATATFGSGPRAVPSRRTENSSASPLLLKFLRSRSTRSSPAGKAG